MEVYGIKFAPLNVPLKRRLQTLAAAAWFVTMAFGGFIGSGLSAYLILFTRFWWLALLYLLWLYIDRETCKKGGRPIEAVRNWAWWKYFSDYFPLKLERLPWVELDPKKNYLFCCFPHGMLSIGAFNAFASNHGGFKTYFPHHQTRIVTLSQHYHMPFFRELALSLGGISASAQSIEHVIGHPEGGYVCALMVGGAAESYYARPGDYRVILEKRKGFVKLALRNGTPLVPVFSFGETDLFNQLDSPEGSMLRTIQEHIRKFIGFAPIIPLGRGFFQYSFGIIPLRKPVTTVVGRPIEVEKVPNPTNGQIDELHKKFMKELHKMFEEQKHNYLDNPNDKHLIIG